MMATRATGEDGTGRELAGILERAARTCVAAWTPELRAVEALAPMVPCVLGRADDVVLVRVLRRRSFVTQTSAPVSIDVPAQLALVVVPGEARPRWVCASRLSAEALAQARDRRSACRT
jgi:hypothetical protein